MPHHNPSDDKSPYSFSLLTNIHLTTLETTIAEKKESEKSIQFRVLRLSRPYMKGEDVRAIQQALAKAGYSLDVDGEVFQIPKKRKSRLGRVATEVVHTLFGISHRANAPPTDPRDRSNELRVTGCQVGVINNTNRKLYTGSVAHYPTAPKISSANIQQQSYI